MPNKRYVRTPLGDFATVAQAAAAHQCEKKTISNRITSRPEEYQYVTVFVEPKPKPTYDRTVKGVRWPIGWNQYRFQDFEVKEQIYDLWCTSHGLDPEQESTALAFFDEMELYTGQQTAAEEDELDEL